MNFTPIVEIGPSIPGILNENLDSYDGTRVLKKNDNFYLIDRDTIYMIAELIIRQIDYNEKITWGLWVKLPAQSFIKMSEDISGEIAQLKGNLITPVIFYENTKGLEIALEFPLKEKRLLPKIVVLNNHSDLFYDFIQGMKKEKYLAWQAKLLGKEINA